MPAFHSASCTINYGTRQALVEWRLDAPAPGYGVSVFRSHDGMQTWDLVSPEDTLIQDGRFVDETVQVLDMTQQLTYRLDLEPVSGDGSAESVVASTLATPREYLSLSAPDRRTLRRMVMAEIVRLRRGAGVPCWILAPLQNTPAKSAYECATGFRDKLGCRDIDRDYMTAKYSLPFQSWVQLRKQQNKREKTQDGEGVEEEVRIAARFPGFPYLRSYYLVVLPDSDRRFLIGEVQTPALFRGLVPVSFDTEMIELNRSDPHYHIPVPALDSALSYPA